MSPPFPPQSTARARGMLACFDVCFEMSVLAARNSEVDIAGPGKDVHDIVLCLCRLLGLLAREAEPVSILLEENHHVLRSKD